jgi:hypothetical protein
VTTLLSCLHPREFAAGQVPAEGELLWCPQCQEYRECATINEYRARCEDCRYSRRFGAAGLTARVRATKHGVMKQHRVTVTCGDEVVEVISPKVTEPISGLGVDDPPF